MPALPDSHIFDDTGQMWPRYSIELRRRYYATTYIGDFIADAIEKLGFVEVIKTAPGYHVKFCPGKISGLAFCELMYWLNDQAPGRVLISAYTKGYYHEMCRSIATASNRICQLRALHQPHQEAIVFEERVLSDIATRSVLAAVLDAWRASSTPVNRDVLFDQLAPLAEQRIVMVEARPDGDLVMSRIGHGFRVPSRSTLHTLEGAPVTAHPDLVFGSWVDACYRLSLLKAAPQLIDADVCVSWTKEGRVRRTYRRLTLPFVTEGGSTLLVGTTCVAADVDLRDKVA
jgi:hypothetical protein